MFVADPRRDARGTARPRRPRRRGIVTSGRGQPRARPAPTPRRRAGGVQSASAPREPPPRDAAGDRHRRRPEHQVAVVAREPGLGLDRDARATTRSRTPRARAAMPARGCRGRPPLRRHHDARVRHSPNAATSSAMMPGILTRSHHRRPGLLPEHRAHRALREGGAVGARVLRPRDAAQQVPRAPQLGEEPEHRDQREQRDHELARARIAPEQVQPVGTPDEPQLGPVQGGEEADHEGLARRTVQIAVDGDQRERGGQPLRVAERVVGDEPARVDQAARRDQAGEQRRDQRQRGGRSVPAVDAGDAGRASAARRA